MTAPNTPLEKVSVLEAQLDQSLHSRPVVLAAITERITKAEAVLAAFNDDSSPGGIDAAIKASGIVDGGKKLLAGFGQDVRVWEAGVRERWITAHFDELVSELEKLLVERSNGRAAFRQTKAEEIGELSKRVVLADGAGATEGELSGMSKKLAEIERDLERRENRLSAASNAVKSFARATTERPNTYMSRHDLFKASRDAVVSVSFEIISESCDLGKTPVRAEP
jgi:hypothetical protein